MKKSRIILGLVVLLCLMANIGIFAMIQFDVPVGEECQETSSDLFAEYSDRANKILVTMTMEEKVGQMFLARMPEEEEVLQEISDSQPGGYILFAKDFRNETKISIAKKLEEYQSASKIPLIFGVDEEGGSVVRVSMFSEFRESKFLSPQELSERGGLEKIIEDSHEKSELLKSLGLNMNLAPVADISTNPDSFMYKRSYGQDAEATAVYVKNVVEVMRQENMISVLKHFPGYGDNVDTHTGIAVDSRTYEDLAKADLLPFESGIQADAPCVLVSHNILNEIDPTMPASLSWDVHEILRNDLGFSGVIMTDDLAMGAIREYSQNGDAAIEAVLAGNDMIITSDLPQQKQEVLRAVEQKVIPEEYVDLAVQRIIAMKIAYGIIK